MYVEELQKPGNDCRLCRGLDGADPTLIQARRENWGCDGPTIDRGRMGRQSYDMGGVILYRCPLALQKNPIVARAWELYHAFKAGHLPQAGGLAQQTAFYRWLMVTMRGLEHESHRWYQSKTPKE